MADWPKVLPNDDGIRPAGKPDECFYCDRKVGEEHGRDCVVIHRKITVRYCFELEVEVPHFWKTEDFLRHRNEGGWCASNAIDAIEKAHGENGCPCPFFQAEFVADVPGDPIQSPPHTEEQTKTSNMIRDGLLQVRAVGPKGPWLN